jgi:hypothetical protein
MAETGRKDAQAPCSQASETKPVNFVTVMWEELQEIRKLRLNRAWNGKDIFGDAAEGLKGKQESEAAAERPTDDEIFKKAHEHELVGLTFSGGGIRSATFNLGVLQGFAKFNLLPMFDYLSTVSGGGYIGGWLESWIYRARKVQGNSDATKQEGEQAEKVALCAEPSVATVIGSSPIRRVQ